MTDRYCVFGNPIAQSRSPQIHTDFASQTGEDINYSAQLVELGGFDAAASEFFAGGGRGLNITAPFKEDAYRFAHRLSPGARIAGAVNTLALDPSGEIVGHTTDGAGLVADLLRQGQPLQGQNILLLGAGGAVRGVLAPLLEMKPAKLIIANRTYEKALQLAKGFGGYGPIDACPLIELGVELGAELGGQKFDLIINGTSASLSGSSIDLPPQILADSCFCYDMVYSAVPTAFMDWAAACGADASDGLGMLVGQAAESFRIWRGVSVDIVKVIATLRAEMLNEQS